MKISKGLKLELHASPKPWPMQFPLAGGGGGSNQWMELYWLHSPRHKTNSPSMTTHGEGAKDEMHSFYPPPSTTYFISWPFCDRAIHSLPCSTLSLWHTLRTCPVSSTHTPLHTLTKPNMLYYRLGIYIAFRVKKQLCLRLCAGLHRSCAQAALYGCTVVRPLIRTGLRIHSKPWHRELQQGSPELCTHMWKKASLSGFPVY